jgi:NADH-quinone oxidoreductase subunit N
LLIFVALGFKIAAAPMHFYAPDVYQGTSSAGAGLLAVAPKIAGIVALVRLFPTMWPYFGETGWWLTLVVAAVTMTIGNVLALWQRNIRRILAYSSIAHAGYMLIGLAVAQGTWSQPADTSQVPDGIAAMLFYLAVYALATTGAFAALAYLARGDREIETLDDLAGLGRSQPGVAAAIALFMFSLAGLPPLAGFFGKLTLFFASLKVYLEPAGGEFQTGTAFLILTLIAAVNAAIAAAYYLRVVATLYFRPSTTEIRPDGGRGALVATAICAIAVILAGIRSGPLVEQAKSASAASASAFRTAGINPAALTNHRPRTTNH